MTHPRSWTFAVAGLTVGLTSCGFDGVTEVQRPVAERSDVTLTFLSDRLPEAAERLGWGGVIPDAEVTFTREGRGSEGEGRSRTDEDGSVLFEGLPPGFYRGTIARRLDPDELADVAEFDVAGVFDVFTISVGRDGPVSELELSPEPSLRSGLVISEYHFNWFFRLGIGTYPTNGFLELYNNGDTTVHLDGKLVGRGFPLVRTSTPCNSTVGFRADPEGLWALEIQQFPGSGRDFPLEPGETAVIATDAIDHSEFIEELLDLTGADFEFSGPSGPDNPGVPNMIDVGPSTNVLGHGIIFTSSDGVAFISDPVDLEGAPRNSLEGSSTELVRIGSDDLIDVAAFGVRNAEEFGVTWCDPWVHPIIHRDWGPYIVESSDQGYLRSINRRIAGSLPDGRVILQHTRSSLADFAIGERTPGWIPENDAGGS